MIKVITNFAILTTLLSVNYLVAQEFHGQAIYESKTLMDDTMQISSPNMTEEMKQQFKE